MKSKTSKAAPRKKPGRGPSKRKLAEARAMFDAGDTPLKTIAAFLNLSADAFRRHRVAQGWIKPPPRSADAVDRAPAADARPTDLFAEIRASRQLLRDELPHLKAALDAARRSPISVAEAEKLGRKSTALIKVMNHVKMLEEAGYGGSAHAGQSDRTLDELRDELTRRIQRLGLEAAA